MYPAQDRSDGFFLPALDAEKVTRNGRPGWLEITAYEGGRMATLSLPSLNAVVIATARDEQTARALVYVLVVRDANGTGRDWPYLIRGTACQQVNGPEGGRAQRSRRSRHRHRHHSSRSRRKGCRVEGREDHQPQPGGHCEIRTCPGPAGATR